ncbi:MAG: hypothetical protein ACP5RF_00100 [Candidatus Micrarchaeia archaeon]
MPAILPFGPYGFTIAVDLVGIMLSVSGIILGLGYALEDKKLKEFGKNELYQSIINGMLVGGLLVLFANNGIMTQAINSLIPSNTSFSCPSYMHINLAICFAYSYLAGATPYTFMGTSHISLLDTTTALLAALFMLSALLGAIASVELNLVFITLSLSYLVKPFISEIQYVISILTTIAVSISAQAFLLMFISLVSTTILLPLGLVLRAFYPTRKLGGFFIAAMLGLYIIFPLSYLFNATLLNAYSANYSISNINVMVSSASSLKNESFGIINAVNSSQSAESGSVINIESDATNLSSVLGSAINKLLSFISSIIMQVFILPIFSLVITGISIREFSQLLGSEAFFGKFKII